MNAICLKLNSHWSIEAHQRLLLAEIHTFICREVQELQTWALLDKLIFASELLFMCLQNFPNFFPKKTD